MNGESSAMYTMVPSIGLRTAVQSQKVVSAHSTSKQKLPFAFQE